MSATDLPPALSAKDAVDVPPPVSELGPKPDQPATANLNLTDAEKERCVLRVAGSWPVHVMHARIVNVFTVSARVLEEEEEEETVPLLCDHCCWSKAYDRCPFWFCEAYIGKFSRLQTVHELSCITEACSRYS